MFKLRSRREEHRSSKQGANSNRNHTEGQATQNAHTNSYPVPNTLLAGEVNNEVTREESENWFARFVFVAPRYHVSTNPRVD